GGDAADDPVGGNPQALPVDRGRREAKASLLQPDPRHHRDESAHPGIGAIAHRTRPASRHPFCRSTGAPPGSWPSRWVGSPDSHEGRVTPNSPATNEPILVAIGKTSVRSFAASIIPLSDSPSAFLFGAGCPIFSIVFLSMSATASASSRLSSGTCASAALS